LLQQYPLYPELGTEVLNAVELEAKH
jgi:hypothetical protein